MLMVISRIQHPSLTICKGSTLTSVAEVTASSQNKLATTLIVYIASIEGGGVYSMFKIAFVKFSF